VSRCHRNALLSITLALFPWSVAQGREYPPRAPRSRLTPLALPASTPEEQGMDSFTLAAAVAFLTQCRLDYRPHQVVVVRHGRRVLDVALYPFSQGLRHDIASVGKMVTGTLIGIAIDRGFIASVDEPVLGFFPDRQIANRDARKEALTIAHLLAQRSGLYHGDDGSHTLEDIAMEASPDWVQWILDRPMAEEPGGTWYYSNANLHLAAAVLAKATGMSPLAFARQYLFGPLHIADVAWETDPQGINIGSGGQQLLPLDLAKIGQLHLDWGLWDGKRVVSREWVARATSPTPGPHPAGWPPEYSVGYHWVVAPDHWEAGGSGGQTVMFYPTEDLVLVVVAGGGTPYSGCSNPVALAAPLYDGYIKPAIRSSAALAPDPAGVAALAARVAAAAVSYEGLPRPVPALGATARAISGKRFVLEPNPLEIQWFSLTFPGGPEASLAIAGEQGVTFRIGLDNVHRFSVGVDGLPATAEGRWATSTRFEVLLDEFALYQYLKVTLQFTGDRVTATVENLACPGGPIVSMSGRMQS
jgi:CubicO group peptidase (beta-lactamase class C family)